MHHHINHCWCYHSNWGGKHYDAPNMVNIDKIEYDEEDWDKLVEVRKAFSEEQYQEELRIAQYMLEKFGDPIPEDEQLRHQSTRECPFLKSDVIDWLMTNIAPTEKGGPAWAIGNIQYRFNQGYRRITLWFQRRNDAKKFIRTFSKYKKRTSYYNHFDDTNLVLDLKTMKYKNRHGDKDE